MQENAKISKIYKKKKQIIKKNIFFTKKTAYVLYLLYKCLRMKVHKMLGRQTNVHVTTFI